MKRSNNDSLPNKKRKLYFWLTFLVLVTVLVVAAVYFLFKLNKPVIASVNATQGAITINRYNIDLTPSKQLGSYASFSYPKGMRLVNDSLVSVPSVEDFTYYAKDIYSWTLAIDIVRTPTGLLSQNPSYSLRQNNPATYSKSSQVVNGQTVIVMTDTAAGVGFSEVAYLVRGGLIATVSLIGSDAAGTGPLQSSFDMVLSSWHWQ